MVYLLIAWSEHGDFPWQTVNVITRWYMQLLNSDPSSRFWWMFAGHTSDKQTPMFLPDNWVCYLVPVQSKTWTKHNQTQTITRCKIYNSSVQPLRLIKLCWEKWVLFRYHMVSWFEFHTSITPRYTCAVHTSSEACRIQPCHWSPEPVCAIAPDLDVHLIPVARVRIHSRGRTMMIYLYDDCD